VKSYRKAAEQDDDKDLLGNYYDPPHGRYYGVSEGAAEACKRYRKAAEQNFADAQADLGAAYSLGAGVPKDLVQAYKWLTLAAARGNKFAKICLGQIKVGGQPEARVHQLTPKQKAEVEKLVREFKPVTPSLRPKSSANNDTKPSPG
jgi:TPR repeat protein